MNTPVTRKQIVSVLYQIEDPELRLNIIDCGLIYDIIIQENNINCVMTFTTPFCPMSESIIAQVRNTLQSFFSHYQIEVLTTFEPEWTSDMISDVGKEMLNMP
ncbi:MAG: metal-sulfur cluster assembly factor [Chitinophagaceae bacterium]